MGMLVSLEGLSQTVANMLKPRASRRNAAYYVFGLEELSKHARETRAGLHTVAEFAEFYCIVPPAKPLVLTEDDYPTE